MGQSRTPTLIALDPRAVLRELQRPGWQSRLYEINITGSDTTRALIRDVQFHPVTDAPEHVDFQRLVARRARSASRCRCTSRTTVSAPA